MFHDCYFLATLGSIANTDPAIIRARIVDFNDGDYGVRLGNSFYRVDADLPVDSSRNSNPSYAHRGEDNSKWVAIFEKAWAHYPSCFTGYMTTKKEKMGHLLPDDVVQAKTLTDADAAK